MPSGKYYTPQGVWWPGGFLLAAYREYLRYMAIFGNPPHKGKESPDA